MLIDSTISFLAAFGLEALVYSDELWVKVPVGVVLAIIVLLISWCVSITFEAKTGFSFLDAVHVLKGGLIDFTRGLRGKTSEPGPDAEDIVDGDGQGRSVTLSRSGILKGASIRLRQLRRLRVLTSSTLINPTGNDGRGPSDVGAVEMDGIGIANEPGDAV
jgi:hypothetical protein